MAEFFNEENIKLFQRKIFMFLNYTIPGVVILDVFFKQGFFSNAPTNLYSFLLFIFWAFILSLPFNMFDIVNLEKIILKHSKEIILKKGGNSQNIKQLEDLAEEDYDYYEEVNSKLHFIFILIFSCLVYFIYKLLVYKYEYYAVCNISPKFIILLNVLIIISISFFPLSWIAEKITSYFVKKYFYKMI